jgi:hypothetical protein
MGLLNSEYHENGTRSAYTVLLEVASICNPDP